MRTSFFYLTLFFTFFFSIFHIHAQEVDMICKIAEQEARNNQALLTLRNEKPNIDVIHQLLDIQIDPDTNYVSGVVTTTLAILTDKAHSVTLDLSHQLTVDSVFNSMGTRFQFDHTDQHKLVIYLDTIYHKDEIITFSIAYQGTPTDEGLGSFVQRDHNSGSIIWTLSEPYGAKDWWPCHQNLLDKIESLDFIVTVPSDIEVASNGVLLETKVLSDQRKRFHWQHNYPIATYLVAFAASNYSVHYQNIALSQGSLPIVNYFYPHDYERNKDLVESHLSPMFQLMDSLYSPYPFMNEKYGHAQFGFGGGIEHQTISFMYDMRYGLTAHELAHQWFGDYITCGSWEDIWLNEGFATYTNLLMYEFITKDGQWESNINNYIQNVTSQPDGSVKVTDTTSIYRIFNARLSYNKAALLLHMIRGIIGDDLFFQSIRNYLQDQNLAYGFARTNDLITHFENTAQHDLTEFMKDWFEGEGYPSYHLSYNQNEELVTLTLGQTTSHASVDFFEMPVQIQFIGQQNDTTFTFNHTFDNQLFEFNLPWSIDSVVIDPEQWIISNHNMIDVLTNKPKIIDLPHTIYPNPAQDHITIEMKNPMPTNSIEITNVLGQNLYKMNLQGQEINTQRIPLDDFKNGIYYIQISYKNNLRSIHPFTIIK